MPEKKKTQRVKETRGGIRRVYKKGIALKDRISLRVIHYKSRIYDIRGKGEAYRTRVINEIKKDKLLVESRKEALIAEANRIKTGVASEIETAKKEVKSSIFTEKDKEIFRSVGRDLGILVPAPRRRSAPKKGKRGASPRVRTSK